MSSDAEEELLRAAEHFQRRFNREIVESYNLCPWAAPARTRGSVLICASAALTMNDAVEAAERTLEDVRTSVELVQVVFPQLSVAWRDWERALSDRDVGGKSWMAAAFHPEFPVRFDKPGFRVRLLRKSPDVAWQFIARDAMSSAPDTVWIDAKKRLPALSGKPARRTPTESVREQNERLLVSQRGEELVTSVEALIAERRQIGVRG